MPPMYHLPIDLEKFGFWEREYKQGKKGREKVLNMCGRDFFYYCLNYYFPERFNPKGLNPAVITEQGIFGMKRIPLYFLGSGLGYKNIPKLFDSLSLGFYINSKRIRSYFGFMIGMMPFRPLSYEKGIEDIQSAIDRGVAVGIDVSMAWCGLLDHIMFVYGYDDKNFYVFDTHIAGLGLEYEKITPEGDKRFIMRLPKSAIKHRWTIFNRVWMVEKC